MKTIFFVAVLSCLIAIFGLAQSQDCARRTTEVSNCASRLASGGNINDFCNTCANTLIRFYQDCAGGAGVDQVKQRKSIMHALHVLYNISIRPKCMRNMQCMHNNYSNSH